MTSDIDPEELEARYIDDVSDCERARYRRFWIAEDRRDFLTAHVLLRRILSSRLGVAPRQLMFSADARGKKSLVGRTIGFSLSHTRGCVACVTGTSSQRLSIGIDVEPVRAGARLDRFVELFLSGSERLELERRTEGRTDWLFRLVERWTAKEATLKAIGCGITAVGGGCEMRDLIGVDEEEGRQRRTVLNERYQVRSWRREDYVISVAVDGLERLWLQSEPVQFQLTA